MSARERAAAFLQIAQEELAAAQALSGSGRRQAAYFCQQTAEKIARAILAIAGVPFGTGHNLGQMAAALPLGHPWREKLNALDKHSPAATRYRYPGPTGRLAEPPPQKRLEEDIRELAGLLEEARQFVSQEGVKPRGGEPSEA
jgi:HEPN domain-containing protein